MEEILKTVVDSDPFETEAEQHAFFEEQWNRMLEAQDSKPRAMRGKYFKAET